MLLLASIVVTAVARRLADHSGSRHDGAMEIGIDEDVRTLSARYAWVDEVDAWTVAVVEGVSAADVVRLYGGDPDAPVGDQLFWQMDLVRDGDSEESPLHVQVVDLGSAVVALENRGCAGSLPGTAQRCSAGGGSFFSVYWDVDGVGVLTQAVDGQVTARFDRLAPLAPHEGASEVRPDWAIGESVGSAVAPRVCLALMQQRTGVAFEPMWLNQPHPTFLVPEQDAAPV